MATNSIGRVPKYRLAQPGWHSYGASLVVQGKHRFFTLSMPSDVLAHTCVVDTRSENPIEGFQRKLDERRAKEIADYIDNGPGTIPSAIVLSAQKEADLQYNPRSTSLRFRAHPRAFLILDGQHRVYGFALAKTKLRVPVIIYNLLTRPEECRLFIDINTKQRPVPTELLLDIKRLADTETEEESLLGELFDLFATEPASPLSGRLSPSSRTKGKLSRVTFYAAMRPIWHVFESADVRSTYNVLASYMTAWLRGLRAAEAENSIVNPALFRALVFLFPDVAQRVSDRYGRAFSVEHFTEILTPFFARVKKATLLRPGNSHIELRDVFLKSLRQEFSL